MKNLVPSTLMITNPEIFALFDRSRIGNPGIYVRRDGDQPAAEQKIVPTVLDEGQFPQGLPDRDVTLLCGHMEQAPAHIMTPNSLRAYRAWAKRNRDCKACFRQSNANLLVSVAKECGMPHLGGTDKQVAWAMSIRHGYLGQASMVRALRPHLFRDSMAWFKRDRRARDAAFLIEHRALALEDLIVLCPGPER